MNDGAVRKSVSFEPEDLERITHLQNILGLGVRGFSSALRIMIRSFDMNDIGGERIRITEKGRQAIREE